MSHAVAPETMGAYVLRKVLALPPMVEVSGSQPCIDPRRRRSDAGGIARSHVELGQVVIQKHAPLHRDYTQYKKAPTFTVGCDSSHHHLPKRSAVMNQAKYIGMDVHQATISIAM